MVRFLLVAVNSSFTPFIATLFYFGFGAFIISKSFSFNELLYTFVFSGMIVFFNVTAKEEGL